MACLKVFAHGGKADKRQRETHKNRDIFLHLVNTVYFNYCEIGKDKCTPAMRMGLAGGPVAPEDSLYFTPRQQTRRRARAAA